MIEYPLPADLDTRGRDYVRDTLGRSFHGIEVRCEDGRIYVDESNDDTCTVERVAEIVAAARGLRARVHYRSVHRSRSEDDPLPDLVASDDVIPIGEGGYVFQGRFWQVFQGLQRYVRAIARDAGAVEQESPPLWPIDLLRRIDYLHEFPHQVVLATGVKEDFASRQAIADDYAKGREYRTVDVSTHFEPSRRGLQPAVCDACYYALRGRRDVGDRVLTTYGKVFRNETSSVGSLDRLPVFTVRDIMAVGSKAFVTEQIETLTVALRGFLDHFGFEATIEDADDPFFAGDAVLKARFQAAAGLKQELRARIPHLGTSIAIGSINRHLDHFGRAFEIDAPSGDRVHSGCIGIGFERATFALFSQYGGVVEAWPEPLRERLGIPASREEMPG